MSEQSLTPEDVARMEEMRWPTWLRQWYIHDMLLRLCREWREQRERIKELEAERERWRDLKLTLEMDDA